MGTISEILGTSEDLFHVGGILGPLHKKNGIHVDFRTADDSAYINVRGEHPVLDHDFATKLYVDSSKGVLIVSRQADCSVSLPSNTGTRGFVAVTTAGSGASLGDVLYDDGSGSGTMSIIPATDGRMLFITQALTGGSITFDGDSLYAWDALTTSFKKIGDIGSTTGCGRYIRYAIGAGAVQQDSSNQIPANTRILRCIVEILTPFAGGITIQVGNTATANLVMPTNRNTPQVAHSYEKRQDTSWGGSDSVVRTTFSAAPAVGSGIVLVEFANPLG